MVEGYFDHLALYRAGVKNVVATCGTALTDGHITLLKKHGERVYLLFDGDSAGRKATVRAMELCLEQKLPAYVITLPQGEDPDSFLQHQGPDAFQQRVADAKPAFEQYLSWLLAKTPPDSVDRKVRLMDEIAPRFKRIADPVERDLYEKEVCRLLGVELTAFRKRLAGERVVPRPTGQPHAPAMTAPPPPKPRDRVQESLLLLLAHYDGARVEARKSGLLELLDPQHRPLAEALLTESDSGIEPETLWQRVFSRLDEPDHKELGARLLMADQHLVALEDWRIAFNDCRQRLQQSGGIKELKQVVRQLAAMTSDHPDYQQLLERANELRKQKSGIQ